MWLNEHLRAARSEQGLTIVELLVAAAAMIVVAAAAMTLVPLTIRNEERVRDKAGAVQEGRVLVERLTRELRQGSAVIPTPTASTISFRTYVHRSSCGGGSAATAIECQVTYSCDTAGTCTRSERNPDGTGSAAAVTMVTGLASGSGFSYLPNAASPTYVTIRLIFPSDDGDDAITVEDGASLRNLPAT